MARQKSPSNPSLFGDAPEERPEARALPTDYDRYARVALPVPLGKAFTYGVPKGLRAMRGSRVLVEFGRQKCLGVVIDEAATKPELAPGKAIKPILVEIDAVPCLDEELLAFLLELARYYLAPIGEVLRLALPALERMTARELEEVSGKEFKAVGRLVQSAELTELGRGRGPELALKGQGAQIFQTLKEKGTRDVSELTEEFGNARAQLKKLAGLGLVALKTREKSLDPFFSEELIRDTPPSLNHGQRAATDAIIAALDAGLSRPFLLDGVTASGKTEVYLHAAEEALRRGRGTILLVPEIALTPQLVGRFRVRLGDDIAVLHSGLAETARLEMWRKLRSGELRVVIGARSALFAPVQNLGLICVDEEHDPSYKQEEGVRYHARDMALLRAHRSRAVVVLGSATPSLASEASVQRGKLTRLILTERAKKNARMPEVEVIDLRRMGPGPSGDPLLSLPLHRAIEKNLEKGQQTILFLNRRGFAPSLICEGCGTIAECPNCSVALTLHRSDGTRLECHYCGFRQPLSLQCDSCGGQRLREEGLGTERVEALLAQVFPSARLARLDRDVASGNKGERILERMRRGEIDILVGTQMVTKGHDLPRVTLVGVLNADAALSLPDFRASERTFHQLVQVAGRAGRDEEPGRVLIQTRNPAHPAVACAAFHDVRTFVEHELKLREEVSYPPFSHIALVRFDGVEESEVRRVASEVGRLVEEGARDVEVLGPAPAPLARLQNRFRYRFLVRAEERPALRKALLLAARAKVSHKVRLSIDVDPMSLL